MRYPCDQVATQAGGLKRHIENKHEGIRYLCDQCEYVATQSFYLKMHQKRKHIN